MNSVSILLESHTGALLSASEVGASGYGAAPLSHGLSVAMKLVSQDMGLLPSAMGYLWI